MQLNGSQIVVECLKEQGVDTVFGYPGGAILNIYDELYKHQNEITHILTSHEQGASHAADGYARATGKVGVCMATSGPGATNLVTGIATAYMDSVPMVAITANVTNQLLGKDSFQEVDIAGVTMPITKHSFIVKDIKKLAGTIRRAFAIAATGRPGPVLVDITKDVTAAKTEYKKVVPKLINRVTETIREEDIEKAVSMIKASKKPMVFVGGGAVISGASRELAEFVEKVDAPVTDTLMGKGAFNGEHKYYVGMLGMHGTKAANLSVTDCDLLVTIGARFSDRVTGNAKKFANKAKILHIDVDPAEVNKNIHVNASIIGDCKAVLEILNSKLEQQNHSAWVNEVMEKKEKFPLTYPEDRLTGPYVIEKIHEITGGDAIITTDVGQHQMWAAQYFKYQKPRTFLSSGGLGTMGYGLGASIGAQVGMPEKRVFNIAGDGCFRMNMNEIATATRYNIPIIQVILNNHVLGMVRQWQTLFYEKRYSQTILEDKVDFVKVAEAMGAKAYRITKREEVEPVLREVLSLKEPVLIDCVIDPDEKVWPMVAPGAAIGEVFTEEDLKKKESGK
ncbi:MAG: biosynthetic-type acetolactate synthase large subunit [Lachnospiraceae bacterium]|nr:biosynthetic-type acetolactate synthase large subunit [Lachnospiraceae bacterium]